MAVPAGQKGRGFTLSLNGQARVSSKGKPLVYTFAQPGTYVISGTYQHGNQTATGQFTVEVIGWDFPAESPACLVGRERGWILPAIPAGVVFETDDTIQMRFYNFSPITNNQSQIRAGVLQGVDVLPLEFHWL
jgi:hypothetical protein